MNSLLYGKDNTPYIVGVIPHDDEHVTVYKRFPDQSVRKYIDRTYFSFLTDAKGLAMAKEHHAPEWRRGNIEVIHLQLHEHAFYTHQITCKSRKNGRILYKLLHEKGHPARSLGNIATQYLIHTGRSMFGGMKLGDLRRLQFDIEALSPNGGFPNAERLEDEIFIISITDNHGFERVLHTGKDARNDGVYVYCKNEKDLIIEFMKIVLRRDPDIIENHNIFGFDLPYLLGRCKIYDIELLISRNNRKPWGRKADKKFAERDVEYTNYTIAGRTVVDTMFLVADYDVFKRDMPSYGLKDAAKYFDIVPEDREYIEGDKIGQVWLSDPNRVLKYALDDAYEARALSEKLLPSTFSMAQMVPGNLQRVHVGGISNSIELLFLRHYLDQKTAIPRPDSSVQLYGGLTGVAKTGIINDLLYIDVASLYPSIMLNYGIKPYSDVLGFFPSSLQELTKLRLETKSLMNSYEEESDEYIDADAKQTAYKRNINSYYGYLSYIRALWKCTPEGDRVAISGQGILVRMMKVLDSLGCQIVECDTDGVLCVRPDNVLTEHELIGMYGDNWKSSEDRKHITAKDFVKNVVEPRMPRGIKLDLDGEFKSMLSYKSKNYALLGYDGKIKTKGVAFKSRGMEPMFRVFLKKAIKLILLKRFEELKNEFDNLKYRIASHDFTIDDIRVKKNLKVSLEDYEEAVKGNTNRAAQYEIWKTMPDRFDKGDAVFYFIRQHNRRKKAVIGYVDATHVDFYEKGHANATWYLSRLYKVVDKFKLFFDDSTFNYLFEKELTKFKSTSLFGGVEIEEFITPINDVETVSGFESLMQKNLAQYTNYYTS